MKLHKLLVMIFRGIANSIKGTVMQIEKSLINDCLLVSEVSWKFCIPIIYNFAVFAREICYFLIKQPTFQQILLPFLFINEALRLNKLKIQNKYECENFSFAICVEAIIQFLLYNLRNCTFNFSKIDLRSFLF